MYLCIYLDWVSHWYGIARGFGAMVWCHIPARAPINQSKLFNIQFLVIVIGGHAGSIGLYIYIYKIDISLSGWSVSVLYVLFDIATIATDSHTDHTPI